MSDPDAVALYTSLRKILKHFSMSPKSTDILNNALNVLEQHNIHMLVWGGTRMAGFINACKQASAILVPFRDTLIAGNIREEEAAVILSAKGLFTLELFSDLHPIFANHYLHCVDSDTILSSQVYNIAQNTAQKLISEDIQTPKSDQIINSLTLDENNNVVVSLKNPLGGTHTQLLKEKVTRNNTIEKIKANLMATKKNILNRLHDNIVDQTESEDSIFNLMTAFDLTSKESKEEKVKKIRSLFALFGKETEHEVAEKWFGFTIQICYSKKIKCSEEELVKQFETSYEKIVRLGRELRDNLLLRDVPKVSKLTQHKLWVKFLSEMGLQCPDLCDLVLIMISIPPNSGYVERAYSYLDQICQKNETD